ncbi:hypothetical protein [Myxococcus landrumensis]|uniref:Uncharacterized protein n=1 Tax=Myxococcus landrumensis TaxID=2813577 RepID=A0ABX7NA78_9BACT|nr:hypothetical protein [Myxococcus landrumus]QSQ15672.1 hypothetical protein JY572_06300 [Myxococcus landrumus]
MTERIHALVLRARAASPDEHEALGKDLNALLLQLPKQAEREPAVALLRGYMENGALEGLGTSSLPADIAATQAALDLGYPIALEVSPERLEALREWEGTEESAGIPWMAIMVVSFVAFITQVACMTLADVGALRTHQLAMEAFGGRPRIGEPSWLDVFRRFMEEWAYPVMGLQFAAGVFNFLFTVTLGRLRGGMKGASYLYLGLAAFGGTVALVQLPYLTWLGLGTLASATGAYVSARLLKSKSR